jgi:hypothetical protein
MGELKKIFDRNFAVGFFVPALAFLAASIGVLTAFGALPTWLKVKADEPLKETTFLAILSFGVALALFSLNRVIVRALEGYWLRDLGRRLEWLRGYWVHGWASYLVGGQWRRFEKLKRHFISLTHERDECAAADRPFPRREERRRTGKRLYNQFPHREDLLLPTAFGNTVRAFEDYPRVMYGYESIEGWSRLNAVLPKDYRGTLATQEASTYFWVNLWLLGLLLLFQYVVLAVVRAAAPAPWIPALCLLGSLAAANRARDAAERWGEWVKGAFDIYLPVLAKKLGLARPASRAEEVRMWQVFCQAFVYRNAASLSKLDKYRMAPLVHESPEEEDEDEDEEDEDEDEE